MQTQPYPHEVPSLAKELDIQQEMTKFNTQRTPCCSLRLSLSPIGTWARLPEGVPSPPLIGRTGFQASANEAGTVSGRWRR